jgi:protein TonB
MSYANRRQMDQNRTVPIILAALITFVMGFALVSGLAFSVIKQAKSDLKVIDVAEPPPPPPEQKPPPPEQKPQPQSEPPPMAPPPIVRTAPVSPPIVTSVVPNPTPAPIVLPTRPVPPPPPAPPAAPVKQQSARAKGDLQSLFANVEYPAAAVQAEVTGTARASLSIGTDGRVTSCSITKSTGNGILDSFVCSTLRRSARFTPAIDSSGHPTTDTVDTPSIRFELKDE